MQHTTSDSQAQGKYVVYLIHFSQPLAHSSHYAGMTTNLNNRLNLHLMGRSGSHIMRAVYLARIPWQLARTWQTDNSLFERQLKDSHNLARYCPVCRKERIMSRLAEQLYPVPLASIFKTEQDLQLVLPM